MVKRMVWHGMACIVCRNKITRENVSKIINERKYISRENEKNEKNIVVLV